MWFLNGGDFLTPMVLDETRLSNGPGNLFLTGALPLRGLSHSATAGGVLLADFPLMACFCIKCDIGRIIFKGVNMELDQQCKNIYTLERRLHLHWQIILDLR